VLKEKNKNDCPKESTKRDGSPLGPVKDSENLARITPLHIPNCHDPESRRMLKGALSVKSLEDQDGWSMIRNGSDMTAVLEEYASMREGRSRNDYGWALVNAGKVRQMLDKSGHRMLCVKDDPQDWCSAHALVRKGRKTNMPAKRIRDKLLDEFEEVITLS